jgi:hypothetical protein
MTNRFVWAIGVAGCAAVLLAHADLAAQRGEATADVKRTCPQLRDFAAFHKCALENMKNFTPPKTADGKPDFNGIWSPTRSAQDIEEIKPGQYGNFPASKSLIVDPPNGLIPYQPWAEKLRRKYPDVYLSPTAVCLPVGAQRWGYSPVSVTGHRIIQQPNQIILSMERLHTYRVIPLNSNRRKLPPQIMLWQGDSRGRFEGNTLVIETTNLSDKVWFDHIGTFVSPALTMEERLTFVDANTLHYQAKFTDPKTFTQPWTYAMAFTRGAVKGMDVMDLEDTTVEFCEPGLVHMVNAGQKLFPGFPTSEAPAGSGK